MQTTEDKTVEDTLKTETQCQVNGVQSDGVTCNTSPLSLSDITVTWRYECTDSGGTTTTQTTTVAATYDAYTCTGTSAGYVQVSAMSKFTPMFPIHFLGFNTSDGSYHVTATAGMRTK